MAPARPVTRAAVLAVRIATIAVILGSWEALARSGWLFRDVVPTLPAIFSALIGLFADPENARHFTVTLGEVLSAVLIGGSAGLAAGLVLGASRFLSRAYEPFLYYLGPTPKIVFIPAVILMFGVGPGSKVALGAISCFFPVALSIAAAMREINPVLTKVGRSFRARPWQMVRKIYLPALRYPAVNGLRLGLGIALIATLLAETKLSNQGAGFLIINAFTSFNIPRMYALLIVLFVIAIAANALAGRFSRAPGERRAG